GINEKVLLIFASLFLFRYLFDRARAAQMRIQSIATLIGLAAYAAATRLVHLPGNERQIAPSVFLGSMRNSLSANLSPKGTMLAFIPVGILLAMWYVASLAGRRGVYYARSDGLVIGVLTLLALVADVQYH